MCYDWIHYKWGKDKSPCVSPLSPCFFFPCDLTNLSFSHLSFLSIYLHILPFYLQLAPLYLPSLSPHPSRGYKYITADLHQHSTLTLFPFPNFFPFFTCSILPVTLNTSPIIYWLLSITHTIPLHYPTPLSLLLLVFCPSCDFLNNLFCQLCFFKLSIVPISPSLLPQYVWPLGGSR